MKKASPKMMCLDIGENDPIGNKLVSIEMDKVASMKFRKTGERRKQSIDRIFGKIVKIETDNARAAAKLARIRTPTHMPRPSLHGNQKIIPFSLEESDASLNIIAERASNGRKHSLTPSRDKGSIWFKKDVEESSDDDVIFDIDKF